MIAALIAALILGGAIMVVNGRSGWWMIALALVIAAIVGIG